MHMYVFEDHVMYTYQKSTGTMLSIKQRDVTHHTPALVTRFLTQMHLPKTLSLKFEYKTIRQHETVDCRP